MITREELELYDHNIRIELPTSTNTLKKIQFIPTFRSDDEYSSNNNIGIARYQTLQWDSELVSIMEDGQKYMHVELEHDLKTNNSQLAYIYNDKLEYLTFPENVSISYTLENYTSTISKYILHIPVKYVHPTTNETEGFREEQTLVLRYNSPVDSGIAMGIGNMYFEAKGYNYAAHPDLPKAEFMLVTANDSSVYSEFLDDYYYQNSLQLTPFDTEYNNRYKSVKIDLNLTSLYDSTGKNILNFTHLIFSVPNPTYELTISEVVILEETLDASEEYGSIDSRLWQYTEAESFIASAAPENDEYQLTLENTPIFYPSLEWLDYLTIYDEEGNYYTAGITGNDHQLHFDSATSKFTWNPSFNQFPEYFGMEFEEPLIVNPNITLYFEYATNTSWAQPILLEVENIDLSSIRVIYDYNYLLKPEFYEWYSSLYNMDHSYENIAYSFKEESEYRVVQYYYEGFTVYTSSSEYTHTFNIGDLSFENDFVNLSLYKVVGITPTLDYEILTDNTNYTITFNKATKELKITDLNSGNGLLDTFDQITVILNYSCAPISSYTEIYLRKEFNQTYLSDPKDTFYNYVDIDYKYTTTTGVLFAENSAILTSDTTSFISIDYSRNADMSASNKLIGYGSELYDNFEIYYDDTSILYVADVDMDGDPDYKLTIDVDGNGELDIIKYGIDDPQGSGEIYWHTVIQDFENYQVSVENDLGEEKRTQWFDIDDRIFARFDFNVGKLLLYALCLPLLPFYITKMMLPDVDYWAQKSVQNEVRKEEHVYVSYYSIKVDNDRDGLPDTQVDYESTDIDIYYEIMEYRETILAAKTQNIFTILGEYVARSISSLFDGPRNDIVFNKYLTKDHLESGNFSSCHWYVRANAPVLTSTYRKFTENVTTTYIDSFSKSTLTVIDFDDEGEIEEQRTYTDDFENFEVGLDEFFSDLVEEHSITDINTGQESEISFDPDLPFTHFENLTWDTQTWGPDGVPVKYDSLYVEGDGYNYTSNAFEKTIILRIPNRYSLYEDYGVTSRYKTRNSGWAEFTATGMLIRPLDGKVYYTSDAEAFAEGTAKTDGFYFYVDSDSNGFYETVYILSDTYLRTDASGLLQFNVMAIGYNYDGYHDLVPYERLGKTALPVSDLDNLGHESTKFGTDWVYNFNNLRNCRLLWEELTPLEELGLKPKDHIFEIYKLVEPSEQNSKFSSLFYDVRHETYSNAWEQYRKQLVGDIIEQVFMSVTAGILSAFVESTICIATFGFGTALAKFLGALTYFLTYTLMTKLSIDIKLQASQARERSNTFYAISQENYEPTSLNHKAPGDRYLQDSMAAALIGHPGGYYTTISGGEPGNQYTAQALVSPPNLYRVRNAFAGFGALLWGNLWNMGESDPDVFTALDFDDRNLDYLLHTSELPSYNQKEHYTYENTVRSTNLYNIYKFTTLGYLENEIKDASNNQLNTIRPTCVDGQPLYEFVDGDQYEQVLPQQVLFRPIILSERRYSKLAPVSGHLTVTTQCKDYGNTKGVDPYEMTPLEVQAGYKAKIPLMNDSFYYPLISVIIDIVKESDSETGHFAKNLIINSSYYRLDSGNLYFTKSLETIISEKYPEFETVLSQTWIEEFLD